MKKFYAISFVVIFLGLAGWLHTLVFPKTKPCVPFAQKEVPNENDGNWTETSGEKNMDAQEHIIQGRVSYQHKTKIGLKLSVYTFFDQIAFKAWACRPNNEKGDVPDHMISVLQDGKWISSYAQKPAIIFQYTDEVASEVDIILLDKNGKGLVDRKILRPGYSLKRPPGFPPNRLE